MRKGQRHHWLPAYIGIGSNLDGPLHRVEQAVRQLGKIRRTRLLASSSLYRSAPLGGTDQPDFINAAAALLTRLDAVELLAELQAIETESGRQRDDKRWGPRVLDLDLLVYANRMIDVPGLRVPHPGIAGRNFVLLPLREIAPELAVPGLGRVASLPVDTDEPRIERLQ